MDPIEAQYLVTPDGSTAIIEMAKVCGLAQIAPSRRDVLRATTYPLGELIADALCRSCRRIIIGIGGSATSDGGMGMLQALGFRLTDTQGNDVAQGGGALLSVAHIDSSAVPSSLDGAHFLIANDVNNPLYGPQGAAHVFAPQKGADGPTVEELDAGLRHWAEVIRDTTHHDIASLPGAGAAGGVGAALLAFTRPDMCSGVQLLLGMSDFETRLTHSHLVITGEGQTDRQTLMGKVPYSILQTARQHHVPVLVLAGRVEDRNLLLSSGFHDILCINPEGVALSTAMDSTYARHRITETVRAYLSSPSATSFLC